VPDPENGNVQVQVIVRRRRSRRHRRNRLIRRLCVAAVFALVTAVASTVALRYFGPSLFRNQQADSSTFDQTVLNRARAVALNSLISRQQPSRPVYPYSVVAGGVEDAKELKWVAEHDPIVAAHYAGFDYNHAQVVRLTLARTVYMSYRIGNHIYWMRRRITLHKGEKVITDGRMTARGRCGNRVEPTAQQPASPAEPAPEKFDEPVRAGEGTAMQSPEIPFQSALLNRPVAPGFDPGGPLSLYNPFEGGNGLALSPPPLPEDVCGPVKKGSTGTGTTIGSNGKKKPGPCGSGGSPSPVPEPGTWVMLLSGLAAIGWQARRKLSRT
jgi:PEP-CTERM motif